jgi:biotin transport system substrate-specific component
MTGLLLGSRRALAAQGLYLLIGLAGLPVFAAGGGPAYVLQPSFGYLPGMVLGAALIGHLADRADPQRNGLKLFSALAINAAGLAVVYLCGTGYLYVMKNIVSGDSTGLVRILQIGMVPYLATDGLLPC